MNHKKKKNLIGSKINIRGKNMDEEMTIGGSVLPISNFILKNKFVKAEKPEYEKYDHGFFLATEDMEYFLAVHQSKEEKKMYFLKKEVTKIKKELEKENMDLLDEKLYLESKKYRQEIKNKIFDKKIENLINIL